MINEKYEKILENIGLTRPEAKTYLTLIELKESQTGKLCEHSGIPSSNIYRILNSLMEKGFINYRIKNNTKLFSPSHPETIKELFNEKENEIKRQKNEITELIEELKKRNIQEDNQSRYKYYEGITGIKSMWYEISSYMQGIKKDTIVKIYTGKTESYKPLLGFYEEFNKVRLKAGIKYQLILPIQEIKHAEKRRKQNAEVKRMDLKNDAEFGIIGDKFFIQYITDKVPKAFLITDKLIASSFTQVFNQLWSSAKK